ARAAARRLADGSDDADFHRGKIATARFYADCLLPQAAALSQSITQGSEAVLALADTQF
ncbi:MAG: acyl-CoA dehydrogenase C-terminal domain-containing protein, partial [Casimicrobiaceae bacterium]